jgi:YVTN family beta-propeller protein
VALALPLVASAGRAYVSNEGDGTVSVIDTIRGEVIGTVSVGKRPRGLALGRDGSRLYVAVSGVPMCPTRASRAQCTKLPRDPAADGVAVVDTRALKVLEHIPAGSDPVELALARGERQLFVASEDSGALTVVDVRGGTPLAHIRVARDPRAVRISPDGAWVAVASDAGHLVTLIDSHLLETVRTTSVGKRPVDLVLTPDGREAYVADELDAAVYGIGMPSAAAAAGAPVAPARARELLRLPSADRPCGIVLDSSRRRLYVGTSRGGARSVGTIAVIALEERKLIRELPIGAHPLGLALTPDDRLLFVADRGSRAVSVLDTASLRVLARIAVGRAPWGVAIAP